MSRGLVMFRWRVSGIQFGIGRVPLAFHHHRTAELTQVVHAFVALNPMLAVARS